MRFALALTLAATLLTTGCLPLGCSSYGGSGDRLYARGSDTLMLCENGGFVAKLATTMIEGKVMGEVAVRGTDGSLAFDLQDNPDGTVTTPQLGAAPWQPVKLDQVARDHADAQCRDLLTRPWWNQ
jgi:hypothetical protein